MIDRMLAMNAAVAGLSFVVALGVLRLLLSRFSYFGLDEPNARSLHQHPVPRTGGIAVLAGIATCIAFGGLQIWVPLLAAFALAAISFRDDLGGIPTAVRLAAHLCAAGVTLWYVLSPMNPFALAVLVLAVAWITNLFNFMDGSDGLAAGMSLAGFGTYGIAAAMVGDEPLAAICWASAGASAAFLLYNYHPARIFLGDVGSIPLGFLAGALGIVGWRDDAWPLWFPLLVFAPFVGDATITLARRALRGQRIWEAHREHYYQRLVQMGFGHRGTALIAYAAMAACAIAALSARSQPPLTQGVVFAGAIAGLAMVAVWVDVRWRRHVEMKRAAA